MKKKVQINTNLNKIYETYSKEEYDRIMLHTPMVNLQELYTEIYLYITYEMIVHIDTLFQ